MQRHVFFVDKMAALVDSDVFVTPSFYGFPMTFLEACAVGTPIITTTLRDHLPWIDGNVGCVTSPNLSEMAEAMYRIISNEELREKFSRNCKRFVKSEFSLEKAAEKLEQVYKEVAHGKILPC
ncbi:MAG: glycosyltransferase family 4 protein [Candidatus Bathyarchaeia archaeon]|nr:glycosyltransferase family 4 protein [Candidatus Bathyarchaeia archaeon]